MISTYKFMHVGYWLEANHIKKISYEHAATQKVVTL